MTPRVAALRAQEEKVLKYLRSVPGSTAFAMTGPLRMAREDVSKTCQRLKRRKLVRTSETQSTYWQAVQQ